MTNDATSTEAPPLTGIPFSEIVRELDLLTARLGFWSGAPQAQATRRVFEACIAHFGTADESAAVAMLRAFADLIEADLTDPGIEDLRSAYEEAASRLVASTRERDERSGAVH